jgi:hypothetical protein
MNLRDWQLRVRAFVARNRVERELDEELSFHVERETHKLVEQGMDPDEASISLMKSCTRHGRWPASSTAWRFCSGPLQYAGLEAWRERRHDHAGVGADCCCHQKASRAGSKSLRVSR